MIRGSLPSSIFTVSLGILAPQAAQRLAIAPGPPQCLADFPFISAAREYREGFDHHRDAFVTVRDDVEVRRSVVPEIHRDPAASKALDRGHGNFSAFVALVQLMHRTGGAQACAKIEMNRVSGRQLFHADDLAVVRLGASARESGQFTQKRASTSKRGRVDETGNQSPRSQGSGNEASYAIMGKPGESDFYSLAANAVRADHMHYLEKRMSQRAGELSLDSADGIGQ